MKRKPKISQAEQSKRFIEAAKEAGVDESKDALEHVLRKITKTPKPKK